MRSSKLDKERVYREGKQSTNQAVNSTPGFSGDDGGEERSGEAERCCEEAAEASRSPLRSSQSGTIPIVESSLEAHAFLTIT